MKPDRIKERYLLECCVDSPESALAAAQGGADRLELCANLVIGGTTPTMALYEEVRELVSLPVHVLIRPRFGDFLYSEAEADIICREIRAFAHAGAEGAVFGCLMPDGTLDTDSMARFMDNARGMSVTLHRAFDMSADPLDTWERAARLGVHTILTSGQAPSCREGLPLLRKLAAMSENGGPAIMAGGGISPESVPLLLEQTAVRAFHMSGKVSLESGMTYRNPAVSMGLPGLSEYELLRTDAAAVRVVRNLLDAAR